MKILVSAYACNPFGGSEPGVGWAAVCRIAREHDVWVLVDIYNKSGWERAAKEGKIPANVTVRFLRESSACSQNRFIAHAQSWLNYADFNRRILAAALDWHREIGFDLCHQVTIAAWRMPSPLWRLPIPFVWGPIGGAGYIPPAFRPMLSRKAQLFERLRDVNTWYALQSSTFRECIENTAVVFAANEETEILLQPYRGERPMVRLPIASISVEKAQHFERPTCEDKVARPLQLFAGGNMEGRKGLSLALQALARVSARNVATHFTIAGGGPEIGAMRVLAQQLGIEANVTFHDGFSGEEYVQKLQQSDIYFLPSFRESTPVTLLEAYLAGCYPVVADTSAQGEIVRLAGGHAVSVGAGIEALIDGLADAVVWCDTHRAEMRYVTTQAAATIAEHFSSERYDKVLREAYATALAVQS